MAKNRTLIYPNEKDFVFTIFDDTDVATLESIKPIYDLLSNLNIKTTKTVWPLSTDKKNSYSGTDTLQRKDYVKYMKELKSRGFEISFHGATMISSKRDDTIRALEIFKNLFDTYPSTYAAHSANRENLYWGSNRFTTKTLKRIYKIISHEKNNYYQGHIEDSPYFWADQAKEKITFIRTFTYDDINLLNIISLIPYQTSLLPYLNNCFITADADNVEEFNNLLREKNQDKLERERGICIISTHFGKGFVDQGKINPKTEQLLIRLSKKNGWFVPVAELLAYLIYQQEISTISSQKLKKLELKFLIHSLFRRFKSKTYNPVEIKYLKKNIQ